MSQGGIDIIGIILQVLILFSLVIITDRLLKIQRLAESSEERRESWEDMLGSLTDAVRKLTGRLDSQDNAPRGESKKPAGAKPRTHPEARKTRKICPECEAFIPVEEPRCSNCGFFFQQPD